MALSGCHAPVRRWSCLQGDTCCSQAHALGASRPQWRAARAYASTIASASKGAKLEPGAASPSASSSTAVLLDKPPTSGAPPPPDAPNTSGIATLAFVSLLWGTFAPAVRFLYQQDATISPAFLTGVRGTLSATALILASLLGQQQQQQQRSLPGAPPPPPQDRTALLLAGLELGVWNFLGTSCQATGLELTTATKAAFLIQLTGVMTPCLAFLTGETIPASVWKACLLALVGSCMIACDELDLQQLSVQAGAALHLAPAVPVDLAAAAAAAAAAGVVADERSSGDAIVILACLFYSMCTVRLSKYAPKHDAVQLAAAKLFFFALLSVAWLVAEETLHLTERPGLALEAAREALEALEAAEAVVVSNAEQGVSWLSGLLPPGLATPLGVTVLVYSALGPGAMGSFLQTKGQAEVPAAQAQVIFSLTPVWSALLASAFLPGESMGGLAWSGAAVIIAASVWVAAAGASEGRAAGEVGAKAAAEQ
jgi:drug/metabolite transporter (DMT)-like permease